MSVNKKNWLKCHLTGLCARSSTVPCGLKFCFKTCVAMKFVDDNDDDDDVPYLTIVFMDNMYPVAFTTVRKSCQCSAIHLQLLVV